MMPRLAWLLSLWIGLGTSGACAEEDPDRFLDGAVGSARFLLECGKKAETLPLWPVNDESGSPVVLHLYSGVPAGILLMRALAGTEDLDRELRKEMSRAAYAALDKVESLAVREDGALSWPMQVGGTARSTGLYTGDAGIGTLFLEFRRMLDNASRDETCVPEIVKGILARAVPGEEGGIHWSTGTDIISGAAGTGLFLLRAHEEMGVSGALEGARGAATWLVTQAIEDGEGWKWRVQPEHGRLYPNFSHGTSGVAFFLLRVSAIARSPALDLAVRKAVVDLEARALEGADGGCTWYHHEGDGEELLYVSFCHGPSGTARMYYELERSMETRWRQRVLDCGTWLLSSGIPRGKNQPSGYWNRSRCCGDAGIGDFYLDLYEAYRKEKWLAAAEDIGDFLLETARREGECLSWVQAEHRVRPEEKDAQTGWAQGAAGIGLFLLRLHLLREDLDTPAPWCLPDTPFGRNDRLDRVGRTK